MTILPKTIGIDSGLHTIFSRQNALGRALASMQKPIGIESVLKSALSHQTVWEKAVVSMQKPTAIEKAIQSAIPGSVWKNLSVSMGKTVSANNAIQSVLSHQKTWEKVRGSIHKPIAINQAVNLIIKSNDIFLKQPSIFTNMAESLSGSNYKDEVFEEDVDLEELFSEASDKLSSAKDENSFIELFKKLHPLLQAFIFFILLHVILPQINNIASNLITPRIESYLHQSSEPASVKIKNIKKIPQDMEGVVTNSLRFITGENVRLRKAPSTKSEILDELTLGQIVIVTDKKKNWIKVEYEYDEGDVMIGWVFTRYTAKFKNANIYMASGCQGKNYPYRSEK